MAYLSPDVLVALMALAMVLPVNAEVTQNIREPIDSMTYSDCSGEEIYYTGVFHDLFTVTEDGAGGYHVKMHENIKATGVGDVSGDTYQLNGVMNEEWNIAADEMPYEATLTSIGNIIGQGSTANMLLRWDAHITINANGETTVYHDNERFDCH